MENDFLVNASPETHEKFNRVAPIITGIFNEEKFSIGEGVSLMTNLIIDAILSRSKMPSVDFRKLQMWFAEEAELAEKRLVERTRDE